MIDTVAEGIIRWVQSANLTVLVITTGTMLAMISLRNSDVASRSRANAEELLYRLDGIADTGRRERRRQSLVRQNAALARRYLRLSVAFLALSTALVLLCLMSGFEGSGRPSTAYAVTALTTVALFMIGLALAASEFMVGHLTLYLNDASVFKGD